MSFLLDVCCCSCLDNPPDELVVSVSGLASRSKILGTDLDNPTDIAGFNGTWYLEGPENNWRDNDNEYDFAVPPNDFYTLFYNSGPYEQLCAYAADINAIPLEITKPYWLDYTQPPPIICTIQLTRLAFVVGHTRNTLGNRYFALALVWLDADNKAIVAATNANAIAAQTAGYNLATQLDTHWNGKAITGLRPDYNNKATIKTAAACAAITEDFGLASLSTYLANPTLFGINQIEVWVP